MQCKHLNTYNMSEAISVSYFQDVRNHNIHKTSLSESKQTLTPIQQTSAHLDTENISYSVTSHLNRPVCLLLSYKEFKLNFKKNMNHT